MPAILQLLIDVNGASESEPFTFACAAHLADLGSGWTITGTPVIEYSPTDSNLTIGAPVIDGTATKVQTTISAARVGAGKYLMTCRYTATDGSGTATQIAYGTLVVRAAG